MNRPIPYRQWLELKEHYEDHEPEDWVEADPENIEFPDDHDRRFDDMYSDRTEIPDGDEPY